MSKLAAANAEKLNIQLNKLFMYNGKGMSLKDILEAKCGVAGKYECECSDGMINYSRIKFNRMGYAEQEAYMNSLKAKKLYFVNDIKVPKIVWDYYNELN